MLLHCAPGGELKDVATGMIIQPKSTTLHTVAMDANVLKVTLGRVLPGCEDMDPPRQPPGADEHMPWLYHGMAKDPDPSWGSLHRRLLDPPAADRPAACSEGSSSRRHRHNKPPQETAGRVSASTATGRA